MEPRNCCVCASRHQNCRSCSCATRGVHCRNCRRGENCVNRGEPQLTDEVGERPEENPEGQTNTNGGEGTAVVGNDDEGRGQASQREEAGQELRFWERWTPAEAEAWVENAYEQVVSFSPGNVFEPPKCNPSKYMIEETTHLIRAYTSSAPIAPFALKTLALLPHLICQRPHKKAKPAELRKAVQRRMELWRKGEVDELLTEAKTIQARLRKGRANRKDNEDNARAFADEMRRGQVGKAIRTLASEEETGGVLPMTAETRQALKDKHPDARPAAPEMLFPGEYLPPHPIIFDCITGDMIWKHALQSQGAAGPSGMDAKGWKALLSTNQFGNAAGDLRDAVATLARKLATEECQNTEALTACRLIPLDKKPGCRPIGIGEVLRRIIGKAVMEVVNEDVRRAVGNLQVCAGQQAGCEAAIHAVRNSFEDSESEAALMVDATNAFNSINRAATLHNVKVKCPVFAQYLENTYKIPARLFITCQAEQQHRNPESITSAEGTTQGDPVAMAMYALGLMRLQEIIRHDQTSVKQVAYADDLTGVGKVTDLKDWWELVREDGPKIGYFPNAEKSVLIVKPQAYEMAEEVFRGSGVRVTMAGERHLGAVIGTREFRETYVERAVEKWTGEIVRLSDFAKTEPQAAYAVFIFGIKQKWNFILRTIPDIVPLLEPLEAAIRNSFIPAITGGRCPDNTERQLLELPPRMGGLGITNPMNLAQQEFENSIKLTATLTTKIASQSERGEASPQEISSLKKEISKQRENTQRNSLRDLMLAVSPEKKRRIEMAQEVGASNWLTTLPIRAKGFSLNKKEFTDAIALRYGWPVDGLPTTCTCGHQFNPSHAMTCKTGGFICMRHDEVRDVTAQMLKEVCHDVAVEPRLLPLQGEQLTRRTANASNEARVDVSARGFWTRGQRAFFDIRIFDPTAHCHSVLSLDAAHRRNELEKDRAYEERIRNVDQGSFTPLVFTTSGGMGPRARSFYARLAETLAERKQQPRSSIVAWMRCRLSFSLLRSALVCLRGTRSLAPRATQVADLDFEVTVVDSRIDRLQ